jgi:histidinol-phosphatase (PHP family)
VFDYHVHSQFSVDCDIPMADSCEAAIAAGITEIAFTDHVEHQKADEGYGYYKLDAYFESIDAVRKTYGDRLTVLAGAEVDFHSDTAEQVEQWMTKNGSRYDFVIGSVHYGEKGRIIFQEYYEDHSVEEVFLPYFDQIEMAIKTKWFDTIGHLDIPKRYLPNKLRNYDPSVYRDRLRDIFKALIAADMAFEINTSGIRQGPKASMPGPAIVRWYVEAGGKLITTGTDSHIAQTIGFAIPTTLDMLTLCGIDNVASFRGRKRTLVPIESLRPAVALV